MSTVILLEDDPGISEGFSMVLRDDGYDVYTAATLQDAPNGSGIDCVVTDLLPLRRYERCRASAWVEAVRACYPGTPLILFSEHRVAVDDAERIGADAALAKPCDIDEFVATVDRVVHERSRGLLQPQPP